MDVWQPYFKKKIEIPKKIFFEKINFWPTLPTSPPKTKHSEICQNIRVIHPTQNRTTQKYRLELNTMKLWFLKNYEPHVCIFSYTYYNLILITRPGPPIHPNFSNIFLERPQLTLQNKSPIDPTRYFPDFLKYFSITLLAITFPATAA